jgi:hypothetical protein
VNREKRLAVITLLDKEMAHHDSWCGETHLQKAAFVLQELLGADIGYEFILYKHGPFSFEFRDDLALMRADGLLEMVVRHPEYGPSYLTTEFANDFLKRFPKTLKTYKAQVKFIATRLAEKNVSELEKVATALFVYKRSNIRSRNKRAQELVRLKPHISEQEAVLATEEVELLVKEAEDLVIEND